MRSGTLIFILVVALVASLIGLLFFGFEGGFGGRGHGMVAEVPRSFWLVLFVVPLVVVVAVLGYALVFPELSSGKLEEKPSSVPTVEKGESPLGAVLRVLNDDERKVVETLVAEGGMMLQKDIRWKTGLSRVKTHRVLFRLAKRGIVSAEKYYNTNKITLADWLTKEKKKP
ncbi:MAG: hypothetical protein OEZ12_05170 [Candidatus Bathyarchaeota archaeon]|nr:hypothetical protein [Candidatus Bathyarchaeota archaeon]